MLRPVFVSFFVAARRWPGSTSGPSRVNGDQSGAPTADLRGPALRNAMVRAGSTTG